MAHQRDHAALTAVRKFRDQRQLLEPQRTLSGIGCAPRVVAAHQLLFRDALHAAVDPQFFERLVEARFGNARLLAQGLRVHGRGLQRLEQLLEHGLVRVVALEEEGVRLLVSEVVHQHRARGLAITTGATDLLIVGLHTAGQAEVQNSANVGFVDAHAECDRGHHDVELPGEELRLHSLTHLCRQACVIGLRAKRRAQHLCRGLCGAAGGRVHDGRQATGL